MIYTITIIASAIILAFVLLFFGIKLFQDGLYIQDKGLGLNIPKSIKDYIWELIIGTVFSALSIWILFSTYVIYW